MKSHYLPIIFLLFILASCGEPSQIVESQPEKSAEQEKAPKRKFPISIKNGKINEVAGRKLLYGGEDSTTHFDITECTLTDSLFHFGIGREVFPALLKPEFMDKSGADSIFADSTRFLLLDYKGVVRAYGIADLTRCEVVNDEVLGEPIMAAYCVLADLGAIYPRTINNRVHTFGLSGYTYHDPNVWDGVDGFVFWDRETESLWWPLIGEAVSGSMIGTKLETLDAKVWKQTTWKDIRTTYDSLEVLIPNQDFERPTDWVKFEN